MANTFFHPTDAASFAQAMLDRVDAGEAAGYVEVRTGSSPGVGSAATGTLLATLPLSDPSFVRAANVLTIEDVTDDSDADNGGEAGYARFFDSDDNAAHDVTVGETGSGEGLELDSTTITAGQTVSITGGTITLPTGP